MSKLMTIAVAISFTFTAGGLAFAKPEKTGGRAADRAAIKKVIRSAYVDGVHRKQDANLMKAGFNDAFIMFVNGDEAVTQVSMADWTARIKPPPADAERPKVKARIRILDITGLAAVARVKLKRDGKLTFTDYMSLYKRDGQWSIVGKTFHRH